MTPHQAPFPRSVLLLALLLGLGSLFADALLPTVRAQNVAWHSMSDGLSEARTSGKPLFVFAEADWCSVCKRMHRDVFSKQTVSDNLNDHFVAVSLNVDSKSPFVFAGQEYTERSFARMVGVRGTPTHIFINPEEEILGGASGYFHPDRFVLMLKYISSGALETMSFEEFESTH